MATTVVPSDPSLPSRPLHSVLADAFAVLRAHDLRPLLGAADVLGPLRHPLGGGQVRGAALPRAHARLPPHLVASSPVDARGVAHSSSLEKGTDATVAAAAAYGVGHARTRMVVFPPLLNRVSSDDLLQETSSGGGHDADRHNHNQGNADVHNQANVDVVPCAQ